MEEDPFSNIDRDGLLDEIARITEVNRQLQSEMSILKDQYAEAINFTNKIEEYANENKKLKMTISDSRIVIDDLKRRLQISQQSNLELSQHNDKIKENVDKQYNEEVADLKLQLSIAQSENVNMNTRFQEQIKNYENSLYTIQSESALLNNQMSKVLATVGNFFNQKYENPQDLIQKVNTASQQIQKQNSELKKANIEISQLSDVQSKLVQLQTSYQNEKNKKKELQTVILRMKKKIDQMTFAHEEQITQFNDLLTQKSNEIERLQLLNQQQTIENQSKKIKKHSIGSQINLIEPPDNSTLIDSHKRQVSNLNTQIESLENNASMLKMQVETLLNQLNDSDNQKTVLNKRLKQSQTRIEELEKELKNVKNENQNQTIKINDLEDQLNQNLSNSKIPIQQCESKIKILEKSLENKSSSIERLEDSFLKQKSEICELTQIKEKLLNAIEMQNHMLNIYNDIINETTQKETQQKETKPRCVEKVLPSIPQFKWPVDKLPKEICDIVTDITENDSLSIESRIKNVFIVLNRWITKQEEKTQNELNDVLRQFQQNSEEYKSFRNSVFDIVKDSIADETEFNQKWKDQLDQITSEKEEQFIKDYISTIIQENNSAQNEIKAINDEIAYLFNSADVHDFPSLIEKHDKIMKVNKLLIDKLNEMKQKNQALKKRAKFVLTEREKENSQQVSILQKSNENSRSQIEQLQTSINKFKEQNEILLKQIKEKEDQIEQLNIENDKHRHRILNDGQETLGTTEMNTNISDIQWKCDVLQNDLKNAEKSCNMWKETAQKANDEKIQIQNRIDKVIDEFESQIVQLTKKHEIENENNQNTILDLSAKLKNQADDSRIAIDKLNQSLIETHKLLDDSLHEVATLKDEQEKLKHTTAIQVESTERSKRLSEAQLKAKILSIDANYSALLDEEKSNAEKMKKQLIEYFIGSFRNFFYSRRKINSYSINDLDEKLDEETFRDYVRKVKEEIEKHQRTENAIRKMIKANENDSVEDALTQFIIQNRPLF